VPGKLQIEMVAVGHGDCFILKWQPDKGEASVVVIDGGPRGGGDKLAGALEGLQARQVDLMVLSHTDADHVDGLLEYAQRPSRLPIARYWGPCLPAFQRHRWLFPARVGRGLDVAAQLEDAIRDRTVISWPVEHASWQSEDGGLRLRLLSPPGRLIERLLVGDDALSLFLQQPMPIGWLLDADGGAGEEDRFADLRDAIRTGEIDPRRVPAALPPSLPRDIDIPRDPAALVAEAARDYGIEPEFFGNSVLNDTSLVLLVEADIGGVPKRMLFTGDLQSFTYLMANHPAGLGLEIVKAPHHGSLSHVGEKLDAYDEVWQWLRPRAVLVSAGGKHGLPRNDFREAALRSGAALFCACRRGKEILVGGSDLSSCHARYGCSSAAHSVRLDFERDRIEASGQACGSSGAAKAAPVIQMVQHLVDPSAILDRLTTAERDNHVKWLVEELRTMHRLRQEAGGQAGLAPVSQADLARRATAERRFRAAASIDVLLDAGERTGKIWTTGTDRYGHGDRKAWIMPDKAQWKGITDWLCGHLLILLPIPPEDASYGSSRQTRKVARVPRELLLAADTRYLAERAAIKFAFPEAMFADAIWPGLVDTLLTQRWTIAVAEIESEHLLSVLCVPQGLGQSFARLSGAFGTDAAGRYLQALAGERYDNSLPEEFLDVVIPLWSPFNPWPRNGSYGLTSSGSPEHQRIFRQPDLLDPADHDAMAFLRWNRGVPSAAPRILAAYLIGGHIECTPEHPPN